jgi:signal transduction histidine kinase
MNQTGQILRLLIEVNEKILKSTPYEDILDFMFNSLKTVIPFDRIGIALLEKINNETYLKMNWVKSRKTIEHLNLPYSTNKISEGLQKILRLNESRIINDLKDYLVIHPDSKATQLIIKDGILSSLTCPLRFEDKAIGVIFFSSFQPGTYRPEHIEVFQQIATEISVIVNHGKLQSRFNDTEIQSKNLNMTLHDLRSPLGVLQGFAEISLERPWFQKLDPEASSIFQAFFRNTKYMIQLVNELSELGLIKSGQEIFEQKTTHLAVFLSEVVQTALQMAAQKEIRFKFLSAPQLPSEAFMDDHKLKRVILNLISNAIKFSNRKSEIIFRVDTKDNRLIFSVEDHGQGIPAHEFDKLFQEFGKTSVKPTEGEVSTGQGLAIAKRFVEMHQGKISVISSTGAGSTFSFWIPITKQTIFEKVPRSDILSQ